MGADDIPSGVKPQYLGKDFIAHHKLALRRGNVNAGQIGFKKLTVTLLPHFQGRLSLLDRRNVLALGD